MTDQDKPEDQTVDPEHEQRFKDLVRRALTTPVTDALREQEREYKQVEKDHQKRAHKPKA